MIRLRLLFSLHFFIPAVALILWGLLLPDCCAAFPETPDVDAELDMLCLRQAYPTVVKSLVHDETGRRWLLLRDGRRIAYDPAVPASIDADGIPRDASVRESMKAIYPLGRRPVPPAGFNPGRIRSQALLAALYGGSPSTLRLVSIPVSTSRVRVAAAHGMAEAFQKVTEGLERLAQDPLLREYIFPLGGQHWRVISGTERLSPHSYGIAVDLNPRRGPYWRWSRLRPHPAQAVYPEAIVELFEANGFIWGGKWHHYDLMHFEYRPELVCKAALLRKREREQSGNVD